MVTPTPFYTRTSFDSSPSICLGIVDGEDGARWCDTWSLVLRREESRERWVDDDDGEDNEQAFRVLGCSLGGGVSVVERRRRD